MDKNAKLICKILQNANHQAVIAGGAVRDMIMNLQPHDFDIATSTDPDTVASILKKNRFCVKEVGKAFGVVLAKMGDDEYEIATFREDSKETDGRRPNSVTFSSMEEDAKRRDLTINAIFFDPISEKFFDFVGGKADIENKIIRFVGDPVERIKEDKLRMMRAVRFALKLGFEIDSDTFDAIKSNASKISVISPERINQELEKMFMIRKPSEMIDILLSSGILKEILPEVERLSRVPQEPKWHPEGAKVIPV